MKINKYKDKQRIGDEIEEVESFKLYENPIFQDITGGTIRPGGFYITQKALEFCSFPKNAQLLDIGCGNGATVEYIQRSFNYHCRGIDLSSLLVNEGLKRNPQLDLVVGDGEKLPYENSTMDGALAECSISLMKNKATVLKEIKRVLKPNGRLIMSDMYIRDKKSNQDVENVAIESCILNAFFLDELQLMMKNIGFEIELFEDYTNYLKELLATIIMQYGSAKIFWEMVTNKSTECDKLCTISKQLKLGYFLCIAKIKP